MWPEESSPYIEDTESSEGDWGLYLLSDQHLSLLCHDMKYILGDTA